MEWDNSCLQSEDYEMDQEETNLYCLSNYVFPAISEGYLNNHIGQTNWYKSFLYLTHRPKD
jgi:hypothetical protein